MKAISSNDGGLLQKTAPYMRLLLICILGQELSVGQSQCQFVVSKFNAVHQTAMASGNVLSSI